MEILRLNKDTFLPDAFVEGLTSAIWTERYLEPGDFELRTYLVGPTLKLLPEMSLLTHRETDEVMYLESSLITLDSEGFPELTLKGRSLDAFSENRFLEGPYPKKKYIMNKQYTAAGTAVVLLWNAFVNQSDNDVTRPGPWPRNPLDRIPNTFVTNSTTSTGTQKKRWLEGGSMYPHLLDALRQEGFGIRTIRPNSISGKVASVSTSDTGLISYETQSPIDKLRWDIYEGVDRRITQPDGKEVIFHYGSGHIEEPSYLWSVADYKTMAFVVSSAGVDRFFRNRPSDVGLGGLDRRSIWVDGGEIELKEIPDQNPNESNNDYHSRVQAIRAENEARREEFKEDLTKMGEVTLKKTDRVTFFDGKITPAAPYEYGKDYRLGDKVTLLGDYGFVQTMTVGEYIRTDDAEGDRGYPGFGVSE